MKITFGKYKGRQLEEIDPGYLSWMLAMAERDPDSFVGAWATDHVIDIKAAITHQAKQKLESNMPEFTLSDSQQVAVDKIVATLLDGDHNVMRLQGGAGYGKSFATLAVVEAAMHRNFTVKACATSYVATQVLLQMLDPVGIDCGTIASKIKLSPVYEGSKEVYEQTPDTLPSIHELLAFGNLLIVDEYSMVSDDIAELFLRAASSQGGKLLVVGDAKQLPSPAQDTPSILDMVEPSVELTEPMRYSKDSTLYQVERQARSNPWEFDAVTFSDGSEVFHHAEWDEFLDCFVKIYRENPDRDVKMLWYKRADVVNANHAIRRALFGESPALVEDGEQLRVQRTVDIPVPGTDRAGRPNKHRFYSGTLYRVLESREEVFTFENYEIPVTQAILNNNVQVNLLFSVTEGRADLECRGGREFNEALADLGSRCDVGELPWAKYREFRNSFLQVAYSYATTVHRTQGMSADVIFTSPSALRQAKPFDAQRLLYVGLTRAKKELHCLG